MDSRTIKQFDIDAVNYIMDELAKNPGFFASEAHFQMAFATEVLKLNVDDDNKYNERFVVYPEFPMKRKKNVNKNDVTQDTNDNDENFERDEIDLLIRDNTLNEWIMIEFKHKTANTSNKSLEVKMKIDDKLSLTLEPTQMGAQNLGKFDCWSDIERLEDYVYDKDDNDESIDVKRAYFILITNDEAYLKDVNENSRFGNDFSLNEKKKWKLVTSKNPNFRYIMKWAGWEGEEGFSKDDPILKSISQHRNRTIKLRNKYELAWREFKKTDHDKSPSETYRGLYEKLVIEIK